MSAQARRADRSRERTATIAHAAAAAAAETAGAASWMTPSGPVRQPGTTTRIASTATVVMTAGVANVDDRRMTAHRTDGRRAGAREQG
jgi:hypothetical protein